MRIKYVASFPVFVFPLGLHTHPLFLNRDLDKFAMTFLSGMVIGNLLTFPL